MHAVHSTVVLAGVRSSTPGRTMPAAALAAASGTTLGVLEDVLRQLRIAGIVRSRRGVDGGWLLARPAGEIGVADVLAAIDGPLMSVEGVPPEALGGDRSTDLLWSALRASVHQVLEGLSIADLVDGARPPWIRQDEVAAAS